MMGVQAKGNDSPAEDGSRSLPSADTTPLCGTHRPGRPDPLERRFVHRNLKQHVDEIHSKRVNWESEPIELHEEPEESVPNSAVSTEPLRTPETAVPPETATEPFPCATTSVLEETEEKSSPPNSLEKTLQEAMNYVNCEDDIDPKFGSPGPGMYSEYYYSDLPIELEGSDLNSTVLKPLQTPEKTVSPKTVTRSFVSTNDTVFEETKEEPVRLNSLDFLMKRDMNKHFNKDEKSKMGHWFIGDI